MPIIFDVFPKALLIRIDLSAFEPTYTSCPDVMIYKIQDPIKVSGNDMLVLQIFLTASVPKKVDYV